VTNSKAVPSLVPEMRFWPGAGLSMRRSAESPGGLKVKLGTSWTVTGCRPVKAIVVPPTRRVPRSLAPDVGL
jgi:hypothetical protein